MVNDMSRSFTAIVLTLLLFGVASTVYATGPELRIAADCTRSVAPGSTAGVAIELQANTNDTTGQRNEISAIDFVVDFDELRFSMQSADVTLPDLVGEKWLITRTEVNATAGTVHVEIAPKFAYPLPTFGDGAVVQLAVHSLLAAPIGCGPLSFVPGSVVFSSPPLGLPVPPGLLHDGGLAVAVPTVTPTPTRTSTPTLTPTTTLTPTVTLTPVLTLTPTVTVTATVTVTPTPTPECDDDEDCDDGTCTIGCIKGSCGPKFASGIPACLERLLPGGGKKATDCKAEWFVAGAPPSGSKQTCINNDPSCDWDLETADQTPHCRFQLAACLNVDGDPRLSDPKTGAACTSADVLAVTLKAPKISGPGPRNAQNLLTAISNIPSGSQGEVNDKGKVTFSPPVTEVDRCSELFDFTVPLSAGQNGTTKKVTKKLKVDIVGSAPAGKRRGPGDSDALAITCLPCVRATKAKCFVENGTPVIELPDICKRHPLANVTDTEQSFTCGAAPECTQTHTVRITRRSPAVGALESFEALLDPFTDKHGKLRGKKCPLPH